MGALNWPFYNSIGIECWQLAREGKSKEGGRGDNRLELVVTWMEGGPPLR